MSISARPASPRAVLAVAALAAAAPAFSGCGLFDAGANDADLLDQIRSGKVVVGSAFTNPGLSTRNADGTVEGLDTEVAEYVINSIADDKGWRRPRIEWRQVPHGQRASMLEHAYVDMIASTYSMNRERADATAFAGPYLLTHQALLVWDGQKDITGLQSLGGHRLCSVTGTTAAGTIKEKLPEVVLEEYDSYEACLNALREGNVEVVSTDAAILEGFEAQEPDTFDVVPLEADGRPLTDEHYGLGLRNDNRETIDAVNEALVRMYRDGSFDRYVAQNLQVEPHALRDIPGDTSFLAT